jgi:PAS domain S-box-containing protein
MSRYIENCDAVEDNLEYSLSILNSAFEASSDGILIVNCEGEVVKFNKKFIEMWHIPDNVSCLMDDKEFLYCVAPQLLEPQKFIKAVEKIYNGSETIESIIEFKNGKIFESYSMPQTIDNSIVGRVWSFRDITKKKRREKELKSSEEKYFTAFMLSPEAIVITTLSDGKFISVNKGFVEMSGYYEEEIIGKSSLEISFWGSKKERDKIAQKLVQNKTIVEYETCFKTKKGALTCLLSASIIELGTIKHVLSVIKDITYKVQEKIYKDILNNALLILNEIDLKSSLKSISLLLKEKGEFSIAIDNDI